MNIDNVAALRNAVNQEQVTIVAVTKTQSVERIREAVSAGLTVLGENRVQEAAEKIPVLKDLSVEWHLIGHLQTNKVKQAVALFSLIQSVDSIKLATEIDRQARLAGKIQDILLQINVAGEESKFGIDSADAVSITSQLETLPNIRLCGLMTIAPFFAQAEQTRPIFRQTRQLFDQLKKTVAKPECFCWLSMGMTHDYEIAIEEGANMIRVGSGIFGERTTR